MAASMRQSRRAAIAPRSVIRRPRRHARRARPKTRSAQHRHAADDHTYTRLLTTRTRTPAALRFAERSGTLGLAASGRSGADAVPKNEAGGKADVGLGEVVSVV